MVDTQASFLTVKYKLHSLSMRWRALLLNAKKRAHLAYDKTLKSVWLDVEAIGGVNICTDQWAA